MPAQLELFEADGTTPVTFHDWATVLPGAQSAIHAIVVKNTGDAEAAGARLIGAAVGDEDVEAWMTLTVAGTAYPALDGAPLGNLAAGASVAAEVRAAVPDGATASTTPLSALLYAEWDE